MANCIKDYLCIEKTNPIHCHNLISIRHHYHHRRLSRGLMAHPLSLLHGVLFDLRTGLCLPTFLHRPLPPGRHFMCPIPLPRQHPRAQQIRLRPWTSSNLPHERLESRARHPPAFRRSHSLRYHLSNRKTFRFWRDISDSAT